MSTSCVREDDDDNVVHFEETPLLYRDLSKLVITATHDPDGYFERWVRDLLVEKRRCGEEICHRSFVITVGPHKRYDVYWEEKFLDASVLCIDFYEGSRKRGPRASPELVNIL